MALNININKNNLQKKKKQNLKIDKITVERVLELKTKHPPK